MLNSKNSDFSPSFGNSDYNEIYFTSSREGGLSEDIDERTGENYTDIYVSKPKKVVSGVRQLFYHPQLTVEMLMKDLHILTVEETECILQNVALKIKK